MADIETLVISATWNARVHSRARWLTDPLKTMSMSALTPAQRHQIAASLAQQEADDSPSRIRDLVDLLCSIIDTCHAEPRPLDYDYVFAVLRYKKALAMYDGHPENPCLYTRRGDGTCTLL